MPYYTWDDYATCIATGVNELTAWRNGDVKLATGECITPDTWLDAILTQPHELTTRQGKPGQFVQGRYGSSFTNGFLRSTHRLQTAQFCYWLMQGCATTQNVPVGYNTHAITINESTTPLNFGYHIQSKGPDNLLWDLLGITPSRLSISCSEYDRTAKQVLEFPYAFLQASSDDFTKTVRPEGTVGTTTKTWDHAVDGGLGAGQTVFDFDGTPCECDIIGFNIILDRSTWLGTRDGDGYATAGLMLDFNFSVQLEVIPTGDFLFDLVRTKKTGYLGADLDLNFALIADASYDKITFDFDKMFMDSFDKNMTYGSRPESYTINLEPLDETSSLEITGIDGLDNDHYENP